MIPNIPSSFAEVVPDIVVDWYVGGSERETELPLPSVKISSISKLCRLTFPLFSIVIL